MKSLRRSRALVLAGMLASNAVFVSACSVDDNGLEEVDDSGTDASEPDASPSPHADGGDATIEEGGELGNVDSGSRADGAGSVTPGADAEAGSVGADAGDATVAMDGEVDGAPDASTGDARAEASAGDASTGPDADAGPGTDGSAADAPADVVAPEDASEDDANDASEDSGDGGSDEDVFDGGTDTGTAPVATTLSIITDALGGACADSASQNCFLPACEDLTGMTGSQTNTALCLATLTCALSGSTTTTYCGMRSDDTNECYCGDSSTCSSGGADGVCIAAEQAGAGSMDPAVVNNAYTDTGTPSGAANTIAACMSQFSSCYTPAGL